MPTYIVTPNMNLPNPVPGDDSGPDYADNLQASLNQVDQHNHSAGQGVLIQPNGMNISSDLPFGGNNATLLNSVRFVSLLTPLTNSAPNIGCLYVSGNELYYNDYSGGNQVQLTLNGTVNATSSGIASGTASAAFSAGTLVVKSSSTSFANIDMQSAVLSNSGNLINQLTLQAPTLSSSYVLSLPAIPAQTNVMTLDTSGNMGSITYDAVGQDMSSVGANAIASTMTSTGANAVANSRTRATGTTVGVGGVGIASSSGSFSTSSTSYAGVTNQSITITTSGRPVFVALVPDGPGTPGNLGGGMFCTDSSTGAGISIFRGSTQIATSGLSATVFYPTEITGIDPVSAGTYTYTVQAAVVSSSGSVEVLYAHLVVYEL